MSAGERASESPEIEREAERDLDPLRALADAPCDADPVVAAEVRRQALGILRMQREHAPFVVWGLTLWSRVVVPVVLLGVVGSYLSLAVEAATAVYR